jgi:hypothetical protein
MDDDRVAAIHEEVERILEDGIRTSPPDSADDQD